MIPSKGAAFKEGIQASSAVLIYGEPLRLPGEFFEITVSGTTDVSEIFDKLRNFAEKLRPMPASRHCKPKVFIHKELKTYDHVFLRDDTSRSSLAPAYSGPYKVIARRDKKFIIVVRNKEMTVSIDRLKQAFTPVCLKRRTFTSNPRKLCDSFQPSSYIS